MSRIPVRFRDSVPVSSATQDFIKKCLEVDESKRMSLSGLKEWSKNGGSVATKDLYEKYEVQQPIPLPKLELNKQISNVDKLKPSKPLT